MVHLFVFNIIAHRKNEPTSPLKQDIRSKPGKVKSGSPKKPLIANSPRSPKTQQKYSPRRKKFKKQKSTRKRKFDSSSDSDSDVSIKLDDGDLTDDDGRDLDLDEYIERLQKKEKAQKDEESRERLTTQELNTQELNTQELNLQLDTLPIYIRSAGNEDIEIELIDHFNSDSSVNGAKGKTRVAQAKVMPLPDFNFQNIDDTRLIENTNEELEPFRAPVENLWKITKNDDEIFKKPSLINNKLKAKTIHYEPQPSTSKETMEIIRKSNNMTTNYKKNSLEKANKNIDTPAKVTRCRSKDISPEENTDTPARVTRSRSKDMSPESNANEPKVKSKDTLSISKEIVPGIKNTSPNNFETADTDNIPNKETELNKYKKRAKDDEDDCILQLPDDVPRNRKPQLSSTTPIHIGDVDMIEKYLPIHGRTKRVLWNKQDPEVGKSFRGTSFTISVETINSMDSMTTVFHDSDENFDYRVNNRSSNAKEHHNESNEESNENSEINLPDLNLIKIEEASMTLPDINCTADKDNTEANAKTKNKLADHKRHHIKKLMTSNKKTGFNLTDLNSTVLDKNRKANESITMSLPDLNFSTVEISKRKAEKRKEIGLADLNSVISKSNKNTPTKRLMETPKNTEVPNKKHESSDTSKPANSRDIVNTPKRNEKEIKSVSSDKSPEMPSLGTIEDMVRITRSSKVSPDKKKRGNDMLNTSQIALLPSKLKKPEKRQQKQILRKSKFQKLGIIEIADLCTDRTD